MEGESNACVFRVIFARTGYADIMAASEEEARQIADDELRYDDVAWDDDWHSTDVMPVDTPSYIVIEKRR